MGWWLNGLYYKRRAVEFLNGTMVWDVIQNLYETELYIGMGNVSGMVWLDNRWVDKMS